MKYDLRVTKDEVKRKNTLRLRVALSGSCYAETGPSSRSPIGLLLRRDRLQGEDLLEVEPLVCRVLVMWCKVVFCALFTVRPES